MFKLGTMKLLSLSILLGSLLIAFNYVWINRISITTNDPVSLVLINKWTGNHCVFLDDPELRLLHQNQKEYRQTICEVDYNGKIKLP